MARGKRKYNDMADRLISNSYLEYCCDSVETPCWLWMRKRSPSSGYGQLNIWNGSRTKTLSAHVVSFQTFKGRKIRAGYVCAHQCNIKHCINPDHLKEQKQSTNIRYYHQTK